MLKQLYLNTDINFDYTTFKTILNDIYNDHTKVYDLSISDLNNIMYLTDTEITLKKDIVIIYYYGLFRLILFNPYANHFKMFNLPQQFENVLKNIDCFCFNETQRLTLLDSQFDELDFYFSDGTYTFDANDHIMYYIFP